MTFYTMPKKLNIKTKRLKSVCLSVTVCACMSTSKECLQKLCKVKKIIQDDDATDEETVKLRETAECKQDVVSRHELKRQNVLDS